MKRHIREALVWVKDQPGVSEVELVQHRRHPKIQFVFAGQTYKIPISCTPSDGNWFKHFQQVFRRRFLQAA